MKECR
jgi:hypothetical protein